MKVGFQDLFAWMEKRNWLPQSSTIWFWHFHKDFHSVCWIRWKQKKHQWIENEILASLRGKLSVDCTLSVVQIICLRRSSNQPREQYGVRQCHHHQMQSYWSLAWSCVSSSAASAFLAAFCRFSISKMTKTQKITVQTIPTNGQSAARRSNQRQK